MKPRRYFPLGKAYGPAFCNRFEETAKLIGNIENGKHTFLIAPRRYGKSSLCEKVIEKCALPCVRLDFHLTVSAKDVERIIINGVIDVIGKSIGSVEKLAAILKKYTKRLTPKFNIGSKYFKLELEISNDSSPAENIAEALLLLDKLLQEKNKQALLLFDEFQEIAHLTEAKSIEGAIRHAGQEMQQLAYIFSGSNSHIMKSMFEDERRPLYKLCRKLTLARIDKEHYYKHLNKIANIMWNQHLSKETLNQIISLTERHPYYINYLCDILWSDNDRPPTIENVNTAWNQVIEEEKSDLLKDFFRLTENQRLLMIYIANSQTTNIYSNEIAKSIEVPVSSIARALSSLTEGGYVEKTTKGYRLIVPAYKLLLKKTAQHNA